MTSMPFCCFDCGQTWSSDHEVTKCAGCGMRGDEVLGLEWSEAEHITMRAWMRPRAPFGFQWVIDQDQPGIPYQWRLRMPGGEMPQFGLVRFAGHVEVMNLKRGMLVGETNTLEEALGLVHVECMPEQEDE